MKKEEIVIGREYIVSDPNMTMEDGEPFLVLEIGNYIVRGHILNPKWNKGKGKNQLWNFTFREVLREINPPKKKKIARPCIRFIRGTVAQAD